MMRFKKKSLRINMYNKIFCGKDLNYHKKKKIKDLIF